MILYHGSNVTVSEPRLVEQNRYLDFGFGFYTTGVLTKEQTLEALKVKKLYNQLVLTSEKALSYLKFIGTVPEEDF